MENENINQSARDRLEQSRREIQKLFWKYAAINFIATFLAVLISFEATSGKKLLLNFVVSAIVAFVVTASCDIRNSDTIETAKKKNMRVMPVFIFILSVFTFVYGSMAH